MINCTPSMIYYQHFIFMENYGELTGAYFPGLFYNSMMHNTSYSNFLVYLS